MIELDNSTEVWDKKYKTSLSQPAKATVVPLALASQRISFT